MESADAIIHQLQEEKERLRKLCFFQGLQMCVEAFSGAGIRDRILSQQECFYSDANRPLSEAERSAWDRQQAALICQAPQEK